MLKRTQKLVILFFITLLLICIGYLVYIWYSHPKYRSLELQDFGSSDAKFFDDGYIVTSKDKRLTLINTRDDTIEQTKIASNWVDCLPDENLIVYCNERGKVGICKYDVKQKMIVRNKVIFTDDNLRIDPAISKIGDTYFMTVTKVEGEVNRSDPNIPNGIYTVQLFQSHDLDNWNYITDIISMDSNIEDIKLNAFNDQLSIMYEVETLDKSVSRIDYMQSTDLGNHWEPAITLVDIEADNEPASILYMNRKYYVFFSSDLEKPGEAYKGSDAFLNIYNTNFNLLKQEKLLTSKDSRILLFEALCNQNEATLLYSYDYLDKDDLIVETGVDINK